ncbi:MAG: hypothetical protein ACTSYB_09045 [Candidatus Helarchaeota archaeon]
MDYKEKGKDLLQIFNEFEQKLRLRGSITPENSIENRFNVFERLGFTTSINSELKYLEQDNNIKILSQFPLNQQSSSEIIPSKFSLPIPYNLDGFRLNPIIKRFKFISYLLMVLLLFAIIVNFIIFFS